MNEAVCKPQYLQIALDIASRIAYGELEEHSKIYGRSVMSSEYGVSPETIRRSLKLLSDMQVVEVKPKSSVLILSAENARKYIERFGANADIRTLQAQLKSMIADHAELSHQILEVASTIAKMDEMATYATPFRNYEVRVEPHTSVVGKTISELCFWQATGATIIALRRGSNMILSPGPYAQLLENDVIVFVGDGRAAASVMEFIGKVSRETTDPVPVAPPHVK